MPNEMGGFSQRFITNLIVRTLAGFGVQNRKCVFLKSIRLIIGRIDVDRGVAIEFLGNDRRSLSNVSTKLIQLIIKPTLQEIGMISRGRLFRVDDALGEVIVTG